MSERAFQCVDFQNGKFPANKVGVNKVSNSHPHGHRLSDASVRLGEASGSMSALVELEREGDESFCPPSCPSSAHARSDISPAANDISLGSIAAPDASSTLRLLALVLIIAIICGMANYALHLFVMWGSCPLGIEMCPLLGVEPAPWWVKALVCSSAGFVLGKGVSVLNIERHVRGGGSKMVHCSISLGQPIPLRAAFFRLIITTINLGSGIPLGYEAPSIFISASVAQSIGILCKMKSVEALSILASVGAASGVAAIFNSPMSGILYAMEEVASVSLNRFTKNTVIFIMMSAATAAAVCTKLHEIFEAPDSKIFRPRSAEKKLWDPHFFSPQIWLPLAFFVGICAVLWGIAWMRITLWLRKHVRRLPLWMLWGGCGVIVSIIHSVVQLFAVGDSCHPWGVRGDFLDMVNARCDGRSGLLVFVVLLLTKGATSAICAAADCSAGLLGPTLVTGGLLGGTVGWVITILFDVADADRFVEPCVCLGMCALFGTVFRFPVTAMLVILELATIECYYMILPIVFASATAAWFGSFWLRMSSWVDELLAQEAALNPDLDVARVLRTKVTGISESDDMNSLSPQPSNNDSFAAAQAPSMIECELLRDIVFEPDRMSEKSKESHCYFLHRNLPLGGGNMNMSRRPSHQSTGSHFSNENSNKVFPSLATLALRQGGLGDSLGDKNPRKGSLGNSSGGNSAGIPSEYTIAEHSELDIPLPLSSEYSLPHTNSGGGQKPHTSRSLEHCQLSPKSNSFSGIQSQLSLHAQRLRLMGAMDVQSSGLPDGSHTEMEATRSPAADGARFHVSIDLGDGRSAERTTTDNSIFEMTPDSAGAPTSSREGTASISLSHRSAETSPTENTAQVLSSEDVIEILPGDVSTRTSSGDDAAQTSSGLGSIETAPAYAASAPRLSAPAGPNILRAAGSRARTSSGLGSRETMPADGTARI
eukprot:GEMP01004703.1.p1 GENE.GEMP01004703.1~~GEMP01004703.1.p1  ORF type:complete len:938 (+),score=170.17 GEMP01004703.1:38-2851(+)